MDHGPYTSRRTYALDTTAGRASECFIDRGPGVDPQVLMTAQDVLSRQYAGFYAPARGLAESSRRSEKTRIEEGRAAIARTRRACDRATGVTSS